VDSWLAEHIVCPRDRSPLRVHADELLCNNGHTYACVQGIPVLLVEEAQPTMPHLWKALKRIDRETLSPPPHKPLADHEIHPFVQEEIASTNGQLYRKAVGKLRRYPIPAHRLPPSNGERLLDVGCNWGRWCISASRLNYRAVGLDPNLQALLAALTVVRQLGADATFVCGDARSLPFRRESFGAVFSYSVLQHFSKPDARDSVAEIGRVLANGGTSSVQMPNKFGIRSMYHQIRLRRKPVGVFNVRYWSPSEIKQTFSSRIGPSDLSVDGFFGLGIQATDLDIIPAEFRPIVRTSEALRKLAAQPGMRWLVDLADSVYVHSMKPQTI
jgi:SAM-dependent methyltransferase